MSKYGKLIRKGDDPILKVVCDPIGPGEDVIELAELLMKTAKKEKNAAGLAAPQIGVAKRMVFIYCKNAKGMVQGMIMINPTIVNESRERSVEEEGCLSYPGVLKAISRADSIEVEYESLDRKELRRMFAGFQARVIQHEIDHLNGICRVGDNSPPDVDTDEKKFTGKSSLVMAAALGAMANFQQR